MNERVVRIAKIVVPVVIALLSLFVLARFAASTEFHAATIEALDEKQTTVAELTAASTAASTAISLIPGDAGTPIADKLADFSSYFLIVFSAIFLEKYLLTVPGAGHSESYQKNSALYEDAFGAFLERCFAKETVS